MFTFRWIAVGWFVSCTTLSTTVDCLAQVDAQAVEDASAETEPANDAEDQAPDFLVPIMNVELSLVKRICEPNDVQMKAIVVAAKKAHQAMADIVEQPEEFDDDQPRSSSVKFMGPNGESVLANPYVRVRQDMAKLLKPIVSEPQYARYTEEVKAREEYERETAIALVVKILDAKLAFSADQRERVQKTFRSEAKDIDIHWLVLADTNGDLLPPLPDQLFVPVLNDAQQKLLASLRRENVIPGIFDAGLIEFGEEWLK